MTRTSLTEGLSEETLAHARVIFDYHQLHQQPVQSDVMLVLGTNDTRVADRAADLYQQGFAPLLVPTGGIAHQHDLLSTPWQRAEAEVFAEILMRRGVPSSALLLETKACNTAENIIFSRQLLLDHGIEPQRLLLVTKPFMQRRSFATYAVEWPEVAATVVSWPSTFDAYCSTPELNPEKIINIMLGDLQRIWVYARRGYSASQRIPAEVKRAFDNLVALGYTRHLISET